jgi:uncharacterized membrane protein YcaP (DUF421 family)
VSIDFQKLLGLGLTPTELNLSQMLLRSVIVFFAMLAMLRLAGRRFLAQRNPLDALLAFLLASLLARDINGSAAFGETLGAGFFLAILYRLLTWLAARFHFIGCCIKGEPQIIVENGEVRTAAMKRHNLSEHDLHEDLRLNGAVDDVKKVKIAFIERNGQISVQRQPQIFNVSVEKEVQIVQIQIM